MAFSCYFAQLLFEHFPCCPIFHAARFPCCPFSLLPIRQAGQIPSYLVTAKQPSCHVAHQQSGASAMLPVFPAAHLPSRPDTKLSSYCQADQLLSCHVAHLPSSPAAQLSCCPSAHLPSCPSAKLSEFKDFLFVAAKNFHLCLASTTNCCCAEKNFVEIFLTEKIFPKGYLQKRCDEKMKRER
jgi:hypothetical protein